MTDHISLSMAAEQLHVTLAFRIMTLMDEHPNMMIEAFRKIPEVHNLGIAMKVLEEYMDK